MLHRGLVLLPGELCEASTIITPTVRMRRQAAAKGAASYLHLPAAESRAGLELRPRPLQGAPPTHPLSIPPRCQEASPRDFASSYLGVPWLLRSEVRHTPGSLQPPELCSNLTALSLSAQGQVLSPRSHPPFWKGLHHALILTLCYPDAVTAS